MRAREREAPARPYRRRPRHRPFLQIVDGDITASTGIIHEINNVLVPPAAPAPPASDGGSVEGSQFVRFGRRRGDFDNRFFGGFFGRNVFPFFPRFCASWRLWRPEEPLPCLRTPLAYPSRYPHSR